MSSLQIRKEILLSSLILDDELMKFQGKRVFDPNDEDQLSLLSSSNKTDSSNKRIFESCDKLILIDKRKNI